jgi:hypothetical protein
MSFSLIYLFSCFIFYPYFVSWLFILDDGEIAISSLPTIDRKKNLRQKAHNGRVTSLLSCPMENKNFLVSGGADNIKVWRIRGKR